VVCNYACCLDLQHACVGPGKALASFSLPVAFAILYGIWWVSAVFLLNISGVMFTALFILLNTGAIWLARWFLKSTSK